MGHLQILRGLPASGKSTYAKDYVAGDLSARVRVNRDTLRKMMHDGEFVKGVTEQVVLMARDALVEKFLRKGMEVVVDDTNLAKRNVTDLIKIANKTGSTWTITSFTDVDVATCIERDAGRDDSVGEDVILDAYNRYLKGKQPLDFSSLDQAASPVVQYKRRPDLFPAYIVDIDGTIADMDGQRSPYDYTRVLGDKPIYPVIDTIRALYNEGNVILFTSGRPESCRQDTEEWLSTYAQGIKPKLFMRETGDMRADYIVKGELFDKFIRENWDVQGVFDDRQQVVDYWRMIGLQTFQCAEGAF